MKTLLFTFSWLLLVVSSYAQSTGWQWGRTSQASGDQEGVGAAVDGSNNVYAIGTFAGDSAIFGAFTLYNGGLVNYFIVKYSPSGNVIWAKAPKISGGGFNIQGISVTTDGIGNVYVTGNYYADGVTFDSILLPNVNYHAHAIFIAKYDSSGNALWVKTVGGLATDVGNGIAADAVGNIYVTGSFSSDSLNFGSITLYNNSSAILNAFIAKYDTYGNAIWATNPTVLTGSVTVGSGISIDANGNSYITGFFNSDSINFGATTLFNPDYKTDGDNKFYIAKYNSSGNVIWAKTSGSCVKIMGVAIATDNYGNIYVTGNFSDSSVTFDSVTLNFSGYAYGQNDFFIVKYDSTGKAIWASNAGGSSYVYGYNVATDIGGNVYVAGAIANEYPDPMFLLTYDPGGNLKCSTGLASGADDAGGLCVDKTGYVYLVQDFEHVTPLIVGPDSLTLTGGDEDFYLAKYKCASVVLPFDSIVTICAGDTFDFHNKEYTAAGIYTDTLIAGGGGDSIVLLTLTVMPAATSNISQCILPGQSYLGYNSTGIYYDTLHHAAANGCDSIVTLNLTVKPLAVGNVQQQICPGDTFQGHTVTGIYTDTIHTAIGCDSAVMLTLSYYPTAASTVADTICDGQNYLGDDSTGTYIDTLHHASANGCDSIITLNLVVEPLAYGITKQRICLGDTFLGHATPGTYYDTIHTPGGCDSLITLELQIDTLPAVIPIWQNGDTLYTLTGYKFYGWYQDSTTLLTGGDSNTYIISHSGNYYVTISNDTQYCVKRSAEIAAYLTGIGSLAPGTQHLNIYPNPAQNTATIEWQPVNGTVQLSISDLVGREINTLKMDGATGRIQIDISGLADGIYVVKLLLPGGELMSGRLAVER